MGNIFGTGKTEMDESKEKYEIEIEEILKKMQIDDEKCYYCGGAITSKKEKKYFPDIIITSPSYGENWIPGQTTYHHIKRKINIPRCSRCSELYILKTQLSIWKARSADWMGFLICFILLGLVVLIFGILALVYEWNVTFGYWVGWIIGITLLFIIFPASINIYVKPGKEEIKFVNKFEKFIKEIEKIHNVKKTNQSISKTFLKEAKRKWGYRVFDISGSGVGPETWGDISLYDLFMDGSDTLHRIHPKDSKPPEHYLLKILKKLKRHDLINKLRTLRIGEKLEI